MKFMTIEQLHDRAMEFTDLAIISKQQAKNQEAINFFSQAFKSEEKALNMAIDLKLGQPTLGILFRSAATLANDKGDIDKMLQIIRKGISLNIPDEFKNDFRQLLEINGIKNIDLTLDNVNAIIVSRSLRKVKRKSESNQIHRNIYA
jgi:tetratricopeptide (TPR) repeat protein